MITENFWAGQFGDDYVARNRVDWLKRERFWHSIIPGDVSTVLEVGCNAGWNLRAIRRCGIDGVGVDVNEKALLEAAGAGFEVHKMPADEIVQRFGPESFDFVFTAGVLIHVHPQDLDRTMAAIVETSRKYVLAVEYAHPEEQMIEYRGEADKLWKRPFGRRYEAMGMELIHFGFVGAHDGFDDCAYWLLKK